MAQWNEIKELGPRAFKKLVTVYSDQEFPIQVRDLCAEWLEERVLKMQDLDPGRPENIQILRQFVNDLVTVLLEKKSSSQLSTEECRRIVAIFDQRYSKDPGALLKILRSGWTLERQLLERKRLKSSSKSGKLGVTFADNDIKKPPILTKQEIDAKLREIQIKANKIELAQDLLTFLLSGIDKIQDEINNTKMTSIGQTEELSSDQVVQKVKEFERDKQVSTMRQQWFTIEKKFMTAVNELSTIHNEILNGTFTLECDRNPLSESKTTVLNSRVGSESERIKKEQIECWCDEMIMLVSQSCQQMEEAQVLKRKVFHWLSEFQSRSATDLDVRLSKFSIVHQNLTRLLSSLTKERELTQALQS